MAKRKALDGGEDALPIKRLRAGCKDHLSNLSHELILRILSFLPRHELAKCQRLSPLYHVLAGDCFLWKVLHQQRFGPSRLRSVGRKPHGSDEQDIGLRLLEHDRLEESDWKRRYKIDHNWARGSCAVTETLVADQPAPSTMLVRMYAKTIYTADIQHGLRAWTIRGNIPHLIARHALDGLALVTSLAVPDRCTSGERLVAVGFEDGSFSVYCLEVEPTVNIVQISRHTPSTFCGSLKSTTICWPYLATMSSSHHLRTYKLSNNTKTATPSHTQHNPELLYSAVSPSMKSSVTLSLAITPSNDIEATVLFPVPIFRGGWTAGIQHIRISPAGQVLSSRTSRSDPCNRSARTPSTSRADSPPSLVYNHPHAIMTRSDNTLASYRVSSVPSKAHLHVSGPNVLHGHTSAVAGAQIDHHHRAVSVTTRGDQLCLWDLTPRSARARQLHRPMFAGGADYITLDPRDAKAETESESESESAPKGVPLRLSEAGPVVDGDCAVGRGWIGIDDENIVLLKERKDGPQSLVVYSFA